MSCFIRERNVLQGENPVNVYITERGRTVAKYPSAVNVRHSIFSRLSPALQLSILRRKAEKGAKESDMRKKVGQFVSEREEREKARMARQKQKRDEREQKHETPDETPLSPASVPFRELKEKKGRFGRLMEIKGFNPIQSLTEEESKAFSGISPEMSKKVREEYLLLLPSAPKDAKTRDKINRDFLAHAYDMSKLKTGRVYFTDSMIKHIQSLISPLEKPSVNNYYSKLIDFINQVKQTYTVGKRSFTAITEPQFNSIKNNVLD